MYGPVFSTSTGTSFGTSDIHLYEIRYVIMFVLGHVHTLSWHVYFHSAEFCCCLGESKEQHPVLLVGGPFIGEPTKGLVALFLGKSFGEQLLGYSKPTWQWNMNLLKIRISN